MEVLVIVGLVLGFILALSLLAVVLRVLLVKYAKHKGYTAENMPALYHAVAFSIYFSLLLIAHLVYLTIVD